MSCALICIVCERVSSYHLGLSCVPRHHRVLLISADGILENCLHVLEVFVLANFMERGTGRERGREREREGESKRQRESKRESARERERAGGGKGGGRGGLGDHDDQ